MNPAQRRGAISCKLADGSGMVVSRYGGQVLSWSDAGGRELLYLSELSTGGEGKPVRGGIPVCFPQFAGRGPLPKHGFARNSVWTQIEQPDANGQPVHLQLRADPATLAAWPHRFLLDLRVGFSGSHLSVTLEVKNTDLHAWTFAAALHTYYRVDALIETALHGLQGVTYEDGLNAGQRTVATEATPRLDRSIDRVYRAAPETVTLADGARELRITQRGFGDTVVWNPGPGGAAGLGDMPAGDERHMLCVEAAQLGDPVELQPGGSWRGSQETHIR